jgi:tripartite-type tricarboxylate transporter receptor subunit TctC
MRSFFAIVLGLTLLPAMQPALAQTYPARPIRVVLPVAPGGGVDLVMRPVAQKLSSALSQQIVLDHRGGAGGNIAAEIVERRCRFTPT